jgi:hypothetical protein
VERTFEATPDLSGKNKRTIMRQLFVGNADLQLQAQEQVPDMKESMKTYAGLVAVIKKLFTLVEDEYEPLNRLRHLKLQKGQTIRSLCSELIALKGESEGALSDKMCIAALVDCLASADRSRMCGHCVCQAQLHWRVPLLWYARQAQWSPLHMLQYSSTHLHMLQVRRDLFPCKWML